MKNILILIFTAVLFVGCKKEAANIFNMFDVKLTLHQTQPYSITENAEINPTDSAMIEYTIESPTTDMYMICLYKTGVTTPAQRIPITDQHKRRAYSGSFKFYAKDIGAGTAAYRIWALDKDGIYLGDGYKTITIDVLSDIRHLANRRLYAPDTVGKVSECYLSLNEGKTYSYTTATANPGKVDLGFFRQVEVTATNPDGSPKTIADRINIYSLTANPLPFTPYDISKWTKRNTLFSEPVDGSAANFKSMFGTSARIEEEAKKRAVNKTHVKTDKSNQFIYFLTAEGKYGVIMIQGSGHYDFDRKRYINIFYKIQN